MSVRRALPLAVLGLGGLLLALAVAALAADRGRTPAVATAPACSPPAPGNHPIDIQDGWPGVVLHVPPGTPPPGRRPLVVVLPGAGQTGEQIARATSYSRLADERGFLVAYPTASGARPFWNVSTTGAGRPDDVGYLRAVITVLTGPAGCGDPSRVGITGVSNGGGMAALMACRAADLLSAAAPVAGGYATLPACAPSRPLPILEIHGLRDHVVPYDGTTGTHAGAVGPFVDQWRVRDACPGLARRSTPAPGVRELRWTCAAGRVIVHDRVLGADHGWPGGRSLLPFSSTVRTWRFLSAFRDDQQPRG
ncbi:alpha/beta hydrolase family esterase [Baekduia soli]|uniref:alpha/beta hydrolase family esterase n=1 Tax=Baekduia soli TaxID=496014 RepID=UPI0016526EBD|nr:PHB depolymerase family esterase [Baekduia soli]